MRAFYKLFCCFFLSTVANVGVSNGETNSNEVIQQRRSRRAASKTVTNVVSHEFCQSSLAEEDKIGKKTLEEVHTFAKLKNDPRASLPDSFSICSAIMTTNCQQYWPTFFSILDNNRIQFMAPLRNRASIESLFVIAYSQETSEMANGKLPPMFPNQWFRSCLAVNTTSGLIHWVVEGTLVMTTISEEVKNSKSRPKDLSKKLVLGARSYGGLWYTLSHKVTNLNIFSTSLPIEKMKSTTGGESCLEEGDYLAWGDMEWILHGQARIETVDAEEPCKGDPYVDLYYTPFPGMDSCMHHCGNLGTRVPSVTYSQDWAKLQKFVKVNLFDKGLNTLFLWLPVEDRKIEGEWRDFYSGKIVMQNFTPSWVGSNGGRSQNCAYLVDANTWADYECNSPEYACMCAHKPSSYLELRGLCPGSSIDLHFKPSTDLADSRKLNLQGLVRDQSGTSITFDDEKDIWILNVKDSNLTGISRASHASFTLGKHNWTIEGDKGCNGGKPYVRELKMSGCQKGNFTCNDGQCVSMDQRCNQLPDCRDESDEMNCNILVLKNGYNKNVPPINSSNPVNVSVSINVLKLVDIDEDDYSIEIQFEITMKWKENRATYHNIKQRDSLNALTDIDFTQLWLPEVIYENTDQKETTRLGSIWEWKTTVIVKREGNSSLSGLDTLDETEIFVGRENSLIMSQTYTHTFQCSYRLSAYPFDTQVILRYLTNVSILSFRPAP